MSIISDALKKANADRSQFQKPVVAPASMGLSETVAQPTVQPTVQKVSAKKRTSGFAYFVIAALLVAPFAMPRLLQRTVPAATGAAEQSNVIVQAATVPTQEVVATAPATSTALLAPAPATIAADAGLAQAAIESRMPTPAIPLSISVSERQELQDRIQGIVWTANKGYYAILNNEVIRVGSMVKGMRVTHITPAGVELSDGVQTVFIEKSF